MEKYYGKDPSQVTIDEAVGMWISLLWLPKTPIVFLSAFFLFRFFDIIKIFPATYFDRKRGGFAIMMDDVVAAVYANVVAQSLCWFNVIG
jgi:phosphatidylglycerophosphatase A